MVRYGYIGLGMMGSAMVEHLIGTGAVVTVFDIDRGAVDRTVELGGVGASSAAEVAAASDVVSICVPAAHHIEAVLSSAGGVVDGAHEGLALLIHSTVHPDTVTQARSLVADWGVDLFDACVAGGERLARLGRQMVLAGGFDEMSGAVRGLLDIYAETIINAGKVGSGAALKIAVNVMTYSQFAAAAVAHDLLKANGVEPGAVLDTWRHLGMLGTLTEQYSALLGVPSEHITDAFRDMLVTQVAIAQKDLSLAMMLGETRPDTRPILSALHDAMPSLYNVTEPA